eukprot:13836586-Alexandrium_andersonii.AAC.1
MSASLVGSEMCIRDRPCVSLPIAPLARGQARQPHELGAAGALDADDGAGCLLYTSDAADDM